MLLMQHRAATLHHCMACCMLRPVPAPCSSSQRVCHPDGSVLHDTLPLLPTCHAVQFEPMVEQTIVHYATDGWLLHKGAEEAKRQLDMERMEQEASQRFQAELDKAHHDKRGDDDDAPDDSRQLRNQVCACMQKFTGCVYNEVNSTVPLRLSGWFDIYAYCFGLHASRRTLLLQQGSRSAAGSTAVWGGACDGGM